MNDSFSDPASFRDPSGFIFYRNGQLFRQVNSVYRLHYDHLLASGLYQELVKQGLLIPHREVTEPAAIPETACKILEPEIIPFISYPYEWSFSQLKAAALLTLKVQKIALQHGMVLKDASAYNVQFRNGDPVFIDTLSFEIYETGKPWVAYRQFCQHFLAPLALMHYTDIRLSSLLKTYLDGIPLDLASKLLPAKTWLQFSLLSHIHLHAKSQQKYARQTTSAKNVKLPANGLKHLIMNLEATAESLNWQPKGTEWAEYYNETNYQGSSFASKKRLVRLITGQLKPQTVWDLGANKGEFSQLAAEKASLVIAFDSDPAAVEKHCRENRQRNVLPLLLDLTNPSPAIGWENRERMSLQQRGPADLALALALIHHLVISNNLPLHRIAAYLATICRQLLIEFVPKTDSQVQKLLATRPDIFPDYDQPTFEAIFSTV
ncbi:MAG TPA: hypothetical protein VK927_05260, partial [Adhaeribacter sp.]|nr:hypothetical protein [Adhaeribacter sp.]